MASETKHTQEPAAWLVKPEPNFKWHFCLKKEEAEHVAKNMRTYANGCTGATIEPLYAAPLETGDAIAGDMEALQAFAQGRALGDDRLIPWAIRTIRLYESDWRDISTIPKDGRRVTAKDRDGHLHEIRANSELDRTIYTHWLCAVSGEVERS